MKARSRARMETRTKSLSKIFTLEIGLFVHRFKFMKLISKYFNSEWSVSKIKIEEKLKTVGFDVRNHRLTIITYDRLLYYVDIPLES